MGLNIFNIVILCKYMKSVLFEAIYGDRILF